MEDKICSFFGHSRVQLSIEEEIYLKRILRNLIEKENYNIFIFGGFGQYDDICHNLVSEIKKEYPHIKRKYCLYDEKFLNPRKRPKCIISENYDEFVYFPLRYNYWYTRIYYRNCEMVDNSDFIVFYVKENNKSGAYKIYQYAKRNKK